MKIEREFVPIRIKLENADEKVVIIEAMRLIVSSLVPYSPPTVIIAKEFIRRLESL